jgi:hypothetical protein
MTQMGAVRASIAPFGVCSAGAGDPTRLDLT